MNERLEYLRGQIRAERISYDEIHELQTLADQIAADDTELLEWADVPEFCECDNTHEQNDTVCRRCWHEGRRHWNDPA